MRSRKIAVMAMALVVSLAISFGCASKQDFRTNTYKTLAVSADVYESGYPAFLDLHRQGIISDDVKDQGREIAVAYWAAYHSAVLAFQAYEAIDSAENQQRVQVALLEVSRLLAELTEYIQPFLKGGK